MRSYIKGVEAVLPTGEVLNLGGKLHKNNAGYDLMQLIVGSEGTLAIITKVVLRLLPEFGSTATLILPYNSRHDAIASVPKMLREAGIPLAVEYVEKDLMEKTAEHIGDSWPVKAGNCYLIVIVSGSSREHVLSQSLKIGETCQQNGALEPLFVEERDKQDRILKIRSNIYSVLKNDTADILDITVPTGELEKVIAAVSEIAKRDGKYFPVFGHAADGNLHIHIMKNGEGNMEYVERLRNEIYKISIEAGGTITGEHGIGKIRSRKLPEYLSPREIELMREIKKIFDPHNILNPGTKVLL
jgi:glycolate oxidase